MPQQDLSCSSCHDDDEINLLELADWFLEKWRWWVLGAIAGGVLGLLAALFLPAAYEASATVKIGHVGQISGENAQQSSVAVESVAESLARMQTLSFRTQVVEQLVQAQQIAPQRAQAWIKKLAAKSSIKAIKETHALEIKIEAPSRDLARAVIQTMVAHLQQRQAPLFHDRVQQIKLGIEQNRRALAVIEKRYATAHAALSTPSADNSRSQSYLELARLSEAGTYVSQQQRLINMEGALLPPFTSATEFMEPIGVSPQPVSPKKTLLVALGLLAGLFAGAMLAFVVPVWQNHRRDKKSAVYAAATHNA